MPELTPFTKKQLERFGKDFSYHFNLNPHENNDVIFYESLLSFLSTALQEQQEGFMEVIKMEGLKSGYEARTEGILDELKKKGVI